MGVYCKNAVAIPITASAMSCFDPDRHDFGPGLHDCGIRPACRRPNPWRCGLINNPWHRDISKPEAISSYAHDRPSLSSCTKDCSSSPACRDPNS